MRDVDVDDLIGRALAALALAKAVDAHPSTCNQCGSRPFSGEVWYCSIYDDMRAKERALRDKVLLDAGVK